jgi:hypothetical protein
MPPCKLRTKKHKKNREILEIKDFSDILSMPPLGTNPVNFERLKLGSAVKISVSEPGERFWCYIAGIEGEIITACVANELVDVPWPVGMPLKFHRNRVYTVYESVEPNGPFSQMENIRLIPANEPP